MIVRRLTELKADHVLILAVLDGLITKFECAMPICSCPHGRGYFEHRDGFRTRWAPSADRFPVPARDGGLYEPTNVRLAHMSCNLAEGGRIGVRRAMAARKANGTLITEATSERSRRNLAAWRDTPEGQAGIRRNLAEGYAKWCKTPEGAASSRAIRLRNLEAARAWQQTPEGQARMRSWPTAARVGAALWRQTPEGVAAFRANGQTMGRTGIGNCKRWNVDRGKQCTCGRHEALPVTSNTTVSVTQ